ncbi:O-antigen ligase family protein [Paenibacillus sp. LHD-117]|uniref:O-antigen ligase family protein n=1 Tax=Paenibacillus sp. LHD-117 TaxID=3071412 RepID=UPI0027E12A46|nr:O-antigen ligase family protein [Paenibacillus sp. LHD-117]MDQ6418673.1 O-antigen ligase family protein [Paenibacillus sp. LHD-117]
MKLSVVAAFIYMLLCVFPPTRALPAYTWVALFMAGLWALIAFISRPGFFTIFGDKPVHRLVIMGFVLFTTIFPYLFGNGVIGNRYLLFGQLLAFYFIYQYNKKYGMESANESIVRWSLPFIGITTVITLFNIVDNPWLARSIKSSGEASAALQARGIGGYEFIYFLTFVCIMATFMWMNKKSLKLTNRVSLGILIFIILGMLTIAFSNFFTALSIYAIATTVIVITRMAGLVARTLALLGSLLLLLNWQGIFLAATNFLIDNLNGRTVERIMSIQSTVINGSAQEGLFAERLPVYEQSWNAFVDNPFFGVVVNQLEFSGGFLVGFGQHSQFLDTFALYGFIIGCVNIAIVLYPFITRFTKDRMLTNLNITMILATVLLFTMNNVTPIIGFAVFFMYPVLYDFIKKRNPSSL